VSGQPQDPAYSDVASAVEEWARAQSYAIVRAAGKTREDRVGQWKAIDDRMQEQRRRILIALMVAEDPIGWGDDEAPVLPGEAPLVDRDVGGSLGRLAAAARDAAESLGWTPTRGAISTRARTTIYRRDGYACVDCGQDDVRLLVIDHRVPVALGGSNDPENLRTLCRPCNAAKGADL
jgi:hypothetical protein